MARPVILDTDPGIDDALALAMAMRSPELRVLAITTVFGNGPVAITTRNAHHLLQRLGSSAVPVYAGAARPLVRDPVFAVETHGQEGLGHAALPPLSDSALNVEAPQAILRVLAESEEPVTIVALGPLTNLALAIALDRTRFCDRVREVIWMGGSAGAPGNTTPVSEFNSWSDPEAVRAVLGSMVPVRMVGLDATRSLVMPGAWAEEMERSTDPEIRWWAEMWRFYIEFHRQSERLEGCIMNDPLAIALLLQPDLVLWASMPVEVVCSDDLLRGQTLCDRFGFTGKRANAAVCLRADGDRALRLALQRGLNLKMDRGFDPVSAAKGPARRP
jgi:purine nucleosidase